MDESSLASTAGTEGRSRVTVDAAVEGEGGRSAWVDLTVKARPGFSPVAGQKCYVFGGDQHLVERLDDEGRAAIEVQVGEAGPYEFMAVVVPAEESAPRAKRSAPRCVMNPLGRVE